MDRTVDELDRCDSLLSGRLDVSSERNFDDNSREKYTGDMSADRSGEGHPRRRVVFRPSQLDVLRGWLLCHLQDAYPSEREKDRLAKESGLQVSQVNNWFINARRRLVPRLQKQQASRGGNLSDRTVCNQGGNVFTGSDCYQGDRNVPAMYLASDNGRSSGRDAWSVNQPSSIHLPSLHPSTLGGAQTCPGHDIWIQHRPSMDAMSSPIASSKPVGFLHPQPYGSLQTSTTLLAVHPAASTLAQCSAVRLAVPACSPLPTVPIASPMQSCLSPLSGISPVYQPNVHANPTTVVRSLPVPDAHSYPVPTSFLVPGTSMPYSLAGHTH